MMKMTHCKRWMSALLMGVLLLGGFLAGNIILGQNAAQAHSSGYGFGPQAYKNGYAYGNGIYFAPYLFTLYSRPDETSPSIGEFHWNQRTGSALAVTTPDGGKYSLRSDHVFFCFYPKLDVAMMPVIGEENGWVEVIYDQAGQKSGWVRLKEEPAKTASNSAEHLPPMDKGEPDHFGVYQTWQEFMKLNAKANGIYWLSGVKEYNRSVRSSDSDEAKIYPITIIRDLKVKFVRGNWMMVEVLDFERNTPIGWVRWRDDEGNLMVFPNISGQYRPILSTSN
jgi:hypothetical protein